ncbi:MAG: CDP-diacylglycerol--serine O-phosphatidyltransferase [Deltaproteobacteria bacterium]|nr:CDP-diacylglycerol--serine O-phosphatidyltransferase [Deltaproteobacteria bacterium]
MNNNNVVDFESHEKKSKRDLAIYILPNLFTSGNLFCGFFSVIASLKGDFKKAALALFIASVFDFLDGRVARMTKTYSRFGEEYDSLADVISFGVAPAVMMYLWALKPYGRIGWLAAFLFLACGALRLARFNVQAQSIEKRHFQGLPIPMAAGVIASSVLLFVDYFSEGTKNIYMLSITFVLAFLMVSEIRYRSFKDFDLKDTRSFGLLVGVVLLLIIFAIHPELALFTLFTTYTASGVVLHLVKVYKKFPFNPRHPSV